MAFRQKVTTTITKPEDQQEKGAPPIKRFKVGGIQVAVWQNEGIDKNTGAKYVSYSFSPTRTYKDNKDGKFKSVTSFRVNDLPKIILCLQKAYEEAVMNDEEIED